MPKCLEFMEGIISEEDLRQVEIGYNGDHDNQTLTKGTKRTSATAALQDPPAASGKTYFIHMHILTIDMHILV